MHANEPEVSIDHSVVIDAWPLPTTEHRKENRSIDCIFGLRVKLERARNRKEGRRKRTISATGDTAPNNNLAGRKSPRVPRARAISSRRPIDLMTGTSYTQHATTFLVPLYRPLIDPRYYTYATPTSIRATSSQSMLIASLVGFLPRTVVLRQLPTEMIFLTTSWNVSRALM